MEEAAAVVTALAATTTAADLPVKARVAVPDAPRPRPERPKSARKGVRTPNTLNQKALSTGAVLASTSPSSMSSQPVDLSAPRLAKLTGCCSEKLVIESGELNGGVVELHDLADCEVLILDWTQVQGRMLIELATRVSLSTSCITQTWHCALPNFVLLTARPRSVLRPMCYQLSTLSTANHRRWMHWLLHHDRACRWLADASRLSQHKAECNLPAISLL